MDISSYYNKRAEEMLYHTHIGRAEVIKNARAAVTRLSVSLCIFLSMTLASYAQDFIPSAILCTFISIYLANLLLISIVAKNVMYRKSGVLRTPLHINASTMISGLYRDIGITRKYIRRMRGNMRCAEHSAWVDKGMCILHEWNDIILKYGGYSRVPRTVKVGMCGSIYRLYRSQSQSSEPPV